MKYAIWLNDYEEFSLAEIDENGEDKYIKSFDWIYEALLHIAKLEGIEFSAKFSESYMLDVLTFNHGLQIEVLD